MEEEEEEHNTVRVCALLDVFYISRSYEKFCHKKGRKEGRTPNDGSKPQTQRNVGHRALHSHAQNNTISANAFGAFGAGTFALTSPRKHFTRQVESLSGPRII